MRPPDLVSPVLVLSSSSSESESPSFPASIRHCTHNSQHITQLRAKFVQKCSRRDTIFIFFFFSLFCSSYFCLFLLWCGPSRAALEAHQILNSLRLWHTIFGLGLGHGHGLRLGLGLGMCMWQMWERRKSVDPKAFLAQANTNTNSKKKKTQQLRHWGK